MIVRFNAHGAGRHQIMSEPPRIPIHKPLLHLFHFGIEVARSQIIDDKKEFVRDLPPADRRIRHHRHRRDGWSETYDELRQSKGRKEILVVVQ